MGAATKFLRPLPLPPLHWQDEALPLPALFFFPQNRETATRYSVTLLPLPSPFAQSRAAEEGWQEEQLPLNWKVWGKHILLLSRNPERIEGKQHRYARIVIFKP